MIVTDTEGWLCLECGEPIDRASGAFCDVAPEPGDVTVCVYCGHVMVFREGLVLDNPDAEECYQIAGDKGILAIQRARARVTEEVRRARERRERESEGNAGQGDRAGGEVRVECGEAVS